MHTKYTDMFNSLIKAYYVGDFDETLKKIIDGHDKSPQETFSIVCSLCGVNIDYDNNYVSNLKKAITKYAVNKKIIEKLNDCSINCTPDKNNKFKCQITCPFDAISYDFEKKSSFIDESLCTHCGICVNACDHARILDKVEFMPLKNLIDTNTSVIAVVDPSIIGQFGPETTIDHLRSAFIKLGFTDMIESAFGGDIICLKDSIDFKHNKNLLITSCSCPIWRDLAKKENSISKNVSDSVSPMVATGRIIKKLDPDSKVVFISPCIARKAESKEDDIKDAIDFVLTFQEIDEIFQICDIVPSKLKIVPSLDYSSRAGRSFANIGGISESVSDVIWELNPEIYDDFKPLSVSGLETCKETIQNLVNNNITNNFIEGMICSGGCIGGPKVLAPPHRAKRYVDNFSLYAPIKNPIYNDILTDLLKELSIYDFNKYDDIINTDILKRKN